MDTLSSIETRDLKSLEETIKSGLRTFQTVGAALTEIRERRLYRETHPTFESYCSERWSFGRQRASQLIAAAAIAENLSTNSSQPENECQCRALKGLAPEAQVEAWEAAQRASGEEQPTGEDIADIVQDGFASLSPEKQLEAIREQERHVNQRVASSGSGHSAKTLAEKLGTALRAARREAEKLKAAALVSILDQALAAYTEKFGKKERKKRRAKV